jgi:glycosyltransferase involved in cell wall biosynthesis
VIAALDATPLTVTSGGVRRYTEELARALRETFPDDTYHLISDQLQPSSNLLDRRWWSIGVQRTMSRLNCAIFHGTDFSVPYIPARPSVMTLHDLSPWMNLAWHHAADRVRRRTPWLLRLGIATMILTDTEAIRRQAIERFRISPARVVTVHLAASSSFVPVAQPRRPRPYFLFAGTIEPRKNVEVLVDAWRHVRLKHDVDLVLAGRRRDDGPVIADEPGVVQLGEVADEQLPPLYTGAIACVYPTLYEGFGLPVLEAMQCGAPVITSHDPAVIEVSNGAAIHVDDAHIAEAMEALLVNPEEQQRRRDLSLRRAAEFSWEKTARQTREVYQEAIERFHG